MFVSFETTSSSKYSTWCQNRGCSYISSRRRIYRSNPAVPCIFPSILNVSTVELQFYQFFKRGRKTDPGLQSSSTRQNIHSMRQQGSPSIPCTVPRVSKYSTRQNLHSVLLQAIPCTVSRVSKHSTWQNLHSMQPELSSSSLWSYRVAVEEEF